VKHRAMVIAATALVVCAPVLAKSQVAKSKEAAFARRVMHDYAECAVKGEPELARQFVLLSAGARLNDKAFHKLFDHRCRGLLSVQLRMRNTEIRAALAEELIRHQTPELLAIDFSAILPLDWPIAPPIEATLEGKEKLSAKALEERQRSQEMALADTYLGHLGECVVRAEPAGSLALFRTKVDGPAELDAMKAMAGSIAGCVAKGQKLTFNRTKLRYALAISYYRLAAASPAASFGASR
jgi:hypothetical protein